jgi:hypothetical protein
MHGVVRYFRKISFMKFPAVRSSEQWHRPVGGHLQEQASELPAETEPHLGHAHCDQWERRQQNRQSAVKFKQLGVRDQVSGKSIDCGPARVDWSAAIIQAPSRQNDITGTNRMEQRRHQRKVILRLQRTPFRSALLWRALPQATQRMMNVRIRPSIVTRGRIQAAVPAPLHEQSVPNLVGRPPRKID